MCQLVLSDLKKNCKTRQNRGFFKGLRRGWHALRHTFASHFIMAGGNILTLQKILGHSDIKVTLVYAHLAPDFLADELERVRY